MCVCSCTFLSIPKLYQRPSTAAATVASCNSTTKNPRTFPRIWVDCDFDALRGGVVSTAAPVAVRVHTRHGEHTSYVHTHTRMRHASKTRRRRRARMREKGAARTHTYTDTHVRRTPGYEGGYYRAYSHTCARTHTEAHTGTVCAGAPRLFGTWRSHHNALVDATHTEQYVCRCVCVYILTHSEIRATRSSVLVVFCVDPRMCCSKKQQQQQLDTYRGACSTIIAITHVPTAYSRIVVTNVRA